MHSDKERMDWLENFYTQTAREEFYWRQFMGQVAALGFRDAIDRAMSNPACGVMASDGKVDCTQSPMGEGGGVEG